MDDRTSEASPIGLDGRDSTTVPVELRPSSFSQPAFFGACQVSLEPKIIISGPEGMLTASITVVDFTTGEWLACEVRPAMAYPADFRLALLWLEERMLHYGGDISPF